MAKKDFTPISLRVPPDVRVDLENLAAKDDRSLCGYIRKVLVRHVADTEKDERKASQ